MKIIQGIKSVIDVAWLDFYSTAKGNPLYLVTPFIYPISVLLIMFLYTRTAFLGFLLAGAALYQAISAGITVFSEVGASKLYFKIQELFVASPTSPFVYSLGIGLEWFLNNSLAMLFYLLIAIWITGASLLAIPLVVIMALDLTIVLSYISFFAATYMESDKDIFTLGTIFTFSIFLLSPVYYPLTALPGFVQYASFLFPSTGPAVVTQWALGLLSPSPIFEVLAFTNIVGYLIIAFILVKKAKWREN